VADRVGGGHEELLNRVLLAEQGARHSECRRKSLQTPAFIRSTATNCISNLIERAKDDIRVTQ
jgi:hypothetical protein